VKAVACKFSIFVFLMGETTDQTWLSRIALGDERAFRSLYDHYAGKLFAMAYGYLKSPIEAQDAVQEIFLKIWEKRAGLTDVKNTGAWLHVLTRNHLINSLQKKIPLVLTGDTPDNNEQEGEQLPSRQLDLKELSGMIGEAVSGLPPRQQKVYRMSRDQGASLQEIADELGISYNTVREHMSYAIKSIRSFLVKHYGGYAFLIWVLVR
jgi:RNA polymerase sigma-70 factor (family 1)